MAKSRKSSTTRTTAPPNSWMDSWKPMTARRKNVGRGCIVRTSIPDGKVALLIGGGAGHEPIYHGLVGHNLADGRGLR